MSDEGSEKMSGRDYISTGDITDSNAIAIGAGAISVSTTGDVTINNAHFAIGVPFQAPPLPPHFIPRPEISKKLKASLLNNHTANSGALVISAIQGLGGIGKSTLASALAYDSELQRHFKEGIFWVTLGQEPDLLILLESWVKALGDYQFRPTTVEATSTHLRTLLHDKTALLILDDTWDPVHAMVFLVGGPNCRVLITTRRVDVADEIGARLYELDVMMPEEAVKLLTARLSYPLDAAQYSEALRIADVIDCLPLALELASVRLQRGISLGDLRNVLEVEVARLGELEGVRRRRRGQSRLEASFNLSLSALRNQDEDAWQGFIWLGVLPEDAVLAAPMAATLWNVEATEANDLLELLWDDALLLQSSPLWLHGREWRAYRMHDLMRDFARGLLNADSPNGLGLTLSSAQELLLERYRSHTQGNLWHTLPDDDYIHAHITWHMEQAKQYISIHHLLQEETSEQRNGWYQACDSLGQTMNFLKSVERAWYLADTSEQLYNIHPSWSRNISSQSQQILPFNFGLQCQYALTIASLNSQATKVTPEILLELLKRRLWSPSKALVSARQMPDPRQRSQAIIAIASHLSTSMLAEALDIVYSIESPHLRSSTIVSLGPYITSILANKALVIAQTISDPILKIEAISSIIQNLGKFLKDNVLQDIFNIIREMPYSERSRALSSLGIHLPNNEGIVLLHRAIGYLRFISNLGDCAWIISTIIPYLPIEEHLTLLRFILSKLQGVDDESEHVIVLKKLAPFVPHPLQGEWLKAVKNIMDSLKREDALATVVPYFVEIPIDKTLTLIRSITDLSYKVDSLVLIIPRLPEGIQTRIIQEAFFDAQRIGSHDDPNSLEILIDSQDHHRAYALLKVLPFLDLHVQPGIVKEILQIAEYESNSIYQIEILKRLIEYTEDDQKENILDIYLEIVLEKVDYGYSIEMISDVCNFISNKRLLNIVHEFQLINDSDMISDVLFSILNIIEDSDLWRYNGFDLIYDLKENIKSFLLLVKSNILMVQNGFIDEVLEQISSIEKYEFRVTLYISLINYLPVEIKKGAIAKCLEDINLINDDKSKADLLNILIERCDETFYDNIIDITTTISEENRSNVISNVIRKLVSTGDFIKSDYLIASIPQEKRDPPTLILFVYYLAKLGNYEKAVEKAREISVETVRRGALLAITTQLTEAAKADILKELLNSISLIQGDAEQVDELIDLIPHITSSLVDEAHYIIQTIRWDFGRVRALALLISIASQAQREKMVSEALETIKRLEHSNNYPDQLAQLLVELAPYVPMSQRETSYERALELLQLTPNRHWVGEAVIAIVPKLPDSLLINILDIAIVIPSREERKKALNLIISRLTQFDDEDMYAVWCSVLHKLSSRSREDLLSDIQTFIPLLKKIGPDYALVEIVYAIQRVAKWFP